jgi:hypothetical protein
MILNAKDGRIMSRIGKLNNIPSSKIWLIECILNSQVILLKFMINGNLSIVTYCRRFIIP